MFTLYYATQYIYQSLKLMVFQLEWPQLQITILLLQMNPTPWWGEKSTSLNSWEWFHAGSLSYHIHTRMHARAHTNTPAVTVFVTDCVNVRIVQWQRQQQGEAEHLGRMQGEVWASPSVERLTHFIISPFLLSHPFCLSRYMLYFHEWVTVTVKQEYDTT